MAFTLPELREELEVLGYGGASDHAIVSSPSQLKLDLSPFWNDEMVWRDWSSSRQGVRAGKSSTRRVHGSPVPGDREFAISSKKSTVIGGGLDAVCFTSDFATELDEMRKMFRIMEGTREALFGTVATLSSTGKQMGLAGEHDLYVGRLMDQWRLVGRTLRCKRSGHPPGTGDASDHSIADPNVETSQIENRNTSPGAQLPPPAEVIREREAQGDSDGREALHNSNVFVEGELAKPGKFESEEENISLGEYLAETVERERREDRMATHNGHANSTEGDLSASKSGNATDFCGSESVKAVEDNDQDPVSTRQESPSAISPGASYQQGGMLYPETFIDRFDFHSDDHRHANGVTARSTHHYPTDNPSPLPSPPFSVRTPKFVLDKLSALSNDKFLAAFEKSLEDLDPHDTIDQETFANVNRKIMRSHVSFRSHQTARSVESENPPDLRSVAVLRTPERRGGGRHQSPLFDRSNIRVAEETVVPCANLTKAVLTEINSAAVTPKRKSAVKLKRSRSSRDSRGSEIVEANSTLVSDITEDRLGCRLSVQTTTPPPSSARKLKSQKVLRHSQAEKDNSPRLPLQNDCASSDPSHPDITSLVLSPIKVRELVSPLKLSGRERSCVANELSEHRQGTCTVCTVRKSSDNSSNGVASSRKPFGKNAERVPSETEASPKQKASLRKEVGASPKQKSSLRKEVGASPKQKLPLRKGLGPSGIYTPLFEPKKNDINSKVLLKTRSTSLTMDYASAIVRPVDRRTPLRSSTENSTSSGSQRTPPQSCKSNFGSSSPYAKGSSLNSAFTSRSATSSPVTRGGPLRGTNVHRVARVQEGKET